MFSETKFIPWPLLKSVLSVAEMLSAKTNLIPTPNPSTLRFLAFRLSNPEEKIPKVAPPMFFIANPFPSTVTPLASILRQSPLFALTSLLKT